MTDVTIHLTDDETAMLMQDMQSFIDAETWTLDRLVEEEYRVTIAGRLDEYRKSARNTKFEEVVTGMKAISEKESAAALAEIKTVLEKYHKSTDTKETSEPPEFN